jgi:hypothetical protein
MVEPTARPPEELLDDEELELLDELELELDELLLEELLELLDELDELDDELLELEDGSPEELPLPPQAINVLMVRHKTPCLSSVSG